MLGLNPLEQEVNSIKYKILNFIAQVTDLSNEIATDGLIYFPAFSAAVHRKYQEEDELLFNQNVFKVQTSQCLL